MRRRPYSWNGARWLFSRQNDDRSATIAVRRKIGDEERERTTALRWTDTQEGVPRQQCLERLLCSAAATVWPRRAEALGRWLRERPEPSVRLGGCVAGSGVAPADTAKTFGWTLMGGWFAEHGCDDFLRQVWTHEALAQQLRERLEASGAWAVLGSCASR